MFRRVEDFLKAWPKHTDATRQIFGALEDEHLDRAVAEGHRTLGGMAWHIVTAIPEVMTRTGLPLATVDAQAPLPSTAAAIRAGYAAASAELEKAVAEHWDDAALEVEDEMYQEPWARGLTLSILMNHEIHHRGQMTVLLRQAGVRVPGVYGPAQEDWAKYGMPLPPY